MEARARPAGGDDMWKASRFVQLESDRSEEEEVELDMHAWPWVAVVGTGRGRLTGSE
jgi:hypothetical protein